MDKPGPEAIINQVEKYHGCFQKYNTLKLNTLQEAIKNTTVSEVFGLIPFLLHVNMPDLPGYVDYPGLPVGIAGYTPTARTRNYVTSRYPSVKVNMVPSPRPFVQMFALMGSSGTIAYTRESDFDYWLCYHASDHKPEDIQAYRAKCHTIENWLFETYNVEVHFYLNEITKVKKNIFADDDENLAGSAIGELLKEEFFRSSIVINGKCPFWWAVPVGCDEETYEEWLAAVNNSKLKDEFIDIGHLINVTPEGFIAGALFQILKSLGSPFKSIIKLGLLERYLNSQSGNPFISSIIKKNVHEGRLEPRDIDAYVIAFDSVYDYYKNVVGDKNILEMLSTSFYLKVEPNLSSVIAKGNTVSHREKTRVMVEYMKEWGWGKQRIEQFDSFQDWGIEPVTKLLNSAKKFILERYKFILGKIETHKIKMRFSDEELQGITRKIFSHFLISENKIDNTLSFKSYPPEKLLSIEYVRESGGKDYWFLSKRSITRRGANRIIIYKGQSLFGLIIWISLNGLFMKDYTRLEIDTGLHSVEPSFLRELIADISTHFHIKKVDLVNRYFFEEQFPVMSYIILNAYSKYAKKINDIIFLYQNSWGETRFEHFSSEFDLVAVIQRILNGCLITGMDFESAVNMISSYPFRAGKEYDRLANVLEEMYTLFVLNQVKGEKRYITMIGNNFVVFTMRHRKTARNIETQFFDSEIKMLYSLSFNRGQRNIIKTDPNLGELNMLGAILGNHNRKKVQIYFYTRGKYSSIFVTDERGSLFFYRKKADLLFEYLVRLYLFAEDVVAKTVKVNSKSQLGDSGKQVEIYQIKEEQTGTYSVNEIDPGMSSRFREVRERVVPLNVSLAQNGSNDTEYLLALPDGTSSGPYTKQNMSVAAATLRGLMQQNNGFHYFVTAFDLKSLKNENYRKFTSFSFSEKSRFELMVEREFLNLI